MESVINQTELTIVFNRDGKIVIPTDKDGKHSIFPKYHIGIRDGYQKNLTRGEVGFFLQQDCLEDESEYKAQMSMNIGKRDKRFEESAVENGFFVGNGNMLTDMGQLTESIYSFQVQEMQRYPNAGYIRAGRNTFHMKTVGRVDVFENVGYRFLVLPKGQSEARFRECSAYSLEELEELTRSQSENCTLDLLIAMRQIDKSSVQRFCTEISKQKQRGVEEKIRE